VIVTVGGGGPRILRFSGSPTEVGPGEAVSLCWQVEGATSISVAPGGVTSTNPSNCATVNPQQTTTYVLTATDGRNQTTANAVISVVSQVRILTFTATPQQSPGAGQTVTLNWTTQNANSVTITGNGAPSGSQSANGSAAVKPNADTTYTLIAYGQRSQISAVVLVRVGGASGTGGLVADAGPNQSVYVPIAFIDASASKATDGSPVTFSWRVAGLKPADIDSPTAARSRVVLKGGFGEYIFEVTVTDKNGNRATAQTKVNFVDP
jgi:hypothetical protein